MADNKIAGKIVDSSPSNTTAVTKSGAGRWVLGAANPYSGSTTVSVGTLKLGVSNAVANSSIVNVSSGAILDLNSLANVSLRALGSRGEVTNLGSNLIISGDQTNVNGLTTYSGFSGSIDGAGSLTKTGTAAMSLRGTNTFTGPVYVQGGTLSVGAGANRFPATDALAINSGAAFQLDASAQTVANLSGSGAINLGGGTFTENTVGSDVFTGVIQDSALGANSTATGNGLRGYYYDNADFTALAAVRDDANINFPDLTTGQLPAGITDTNYVSVRWVGQVLAPVTGSYLFVTRTDDGCRLWVNGSLLIDDWASQSATVKTATYSLTAGTKYDLVMEYLNITGPATATLSWMPPGDTTTNAIPSNYLFLPGAGSLVKANSGTLTLGSANNYTGTTFVSAGTLDIEADGGLGLGNVMVNSNATLVLHGGATNGYISTGADLILNGASSTVNLNFAGANAIHGLSLDGGVTYQATGTYNSGSSSVFTGTGSLIVGASSSSVAIATSGSPAVYGSSVTFTATVTGSGATPTGTVNFFDNGNFIGAGTLDGTATGTLTVSNLLVTSAHSVTAVYLGDATHVTGASSAVAQTVTALAVTPGTLTVSNKVYDATTNATLATQPVAGLLASDVNFVHLTNGVASFANKTVGPAKTVTISGLALAGILAANYTLSVSNTTATADITAKALTVTNLLANNKVYDGSTNASFNTNTAALIGVISGDVATLNTAGLTGAFASPGVGSALPVTLFGLALAGADAGNYTITAPALTANITLGNSSLALASSANPAAAGTNVTFTATVTGATVPTGNVIFLTNNVALATNSLAAGVATAAVTFLSPSTNVTITARYSGDTNFNGSTNTLSQVVANPPTSIIISGLGTNATLTWSGVFSLQMATNFPATWVTITNAASPYPVIATNGSIFYRLKQ